MAIRNTIGHIRGAPHPGLANRLAGFLQSSTVRAALVEAGAIDPDEIPATVVIAWPSLVEANEQAVSELTSIFLN
jgi:hypothetical protein